MTDWTKLKVPELKAELKTRGLPQNGLKAALVARLEEADTEKVAADEPQQSGQGDDDATIESNTVDNSPREEEAAPPQPEAHEGTVPTPPTPSIETPNAQAASDDIKKDAQSAAAGAEEAAAAAAAQAVVPPIIAQSSKEESMPDLTPVGTTELKEDIEKRKRRSLSPPPANGDAPRKRQRQDIDVAVTNTDKVATTEEDARWVENHNNLDSAEVNAEMEEVAEEGVQGNPTIVDTATEEVVVEHASRRASEEQQQRPALAPGAANMEEPPRYKFRSPEDHPMDDYETNYGLRNDRSPSPPFDRRSPAADYGIRSPEVERSVAPATHPATSALYIRDFQRPLNRNQLKDHITTLATPPGQSPDPDVIIDFFLDSICTHAFIAFTNTSAASRVRSEIHDRIWPDERTRRPLWADFIPDSKVTEWIETEKSAAAARSGKKWEVAYDMDGDGNVTASLQETGEVPAQLRKQSSASIAPTPRLGVVGAPLGPRADQRRRDDGLRFDAPVDRRPSFDHSAQYPPTPLQSNVDMIFTKTSPSVSFLPVPKELAERRLDNIDNLYAKDAEAEFRVNSESHRYTFEGETLVDRGPEIFPGIRRPPGVRRVPLPRNLLAGGARPLPPARGSRGYDRNDDRGYRDCRGDRGPPGGRGGYGGGFDRGDRYERPRDGYRGDRGFDGGDRYERPRGGYRADRGFDGGDRYERPSDRRKDFGPGSNYRNNYREGAHWRDGVTNSKHLG